MNEAETRLMPPEHHVRADQDPYRAVCDYIADMTALRDPRASAD